MADTIRCREFAPCPAAWPSGKAEDCKSFTPSSNLGAASFCGEFQIHHIWCFQGCFDALEHNMWCFSKCRFFDSEPDLAEGERKVKRGLTGAPSAVPRIHLPTVRSRLLPRRPHLPPTAWAPRVTLNCPQSTSKTLLRPLVALGRQTPTWLATP